MKVKLEIIVDIEPDFTTKKDTILWHIDSYGAKLMLDIGEIGEDIGVVTEVISCEEVD